MTDLQLSFPEPDEAEARCEHGRSDDEGRCPFCHYPEALYGGTPPHVAASDTSRAAALAALPMAGTKRWDVLWALRLAADGLTDEELCERTGIAPSTLRPRRVELVEGGHVRDSGSRRPTVSGRSATVWEVAS